MRLGDRRFYFVRAANIRRLLELGKEDQNKKSRKEIKNVRGESAKEI